MVPDIVLIFHYLFQFHRYLVEKKQNQSYLKFYVEPILKSYRYLPWVQMHTLIFHET